jgi:hypothetical protein
LSKRVHRAEQPEAVRESFGSACGSDELVEGRSASFVARQRRCVVEEQHFPFIAEADNVLF